MLELGLDNTNEGWRCVLNVGEDVVWRDPKFYESSRDARAAANAHVVEVFSVLFSMSGNELQPLIDILENIDPEWLEAQALERETFGGKSYTENILDIIKERCYAAT